MLVKTRAYGIIRMMKYAGKIRQSGLEAPVGLMR
jgi:hypothetical protein